MSLHGALGEGFAIQHDPSVSGATRPGEYLSRGLATFSAAATVTVTVPLPVRTVTHAVASVKSTTNQAINVTVGTYSKNTFIIYAWGLPGTHAGTIGPAVSETFTTAVALAAPSDGFFAVALAGGGLTSLTLTRGGFSTTLALPTSTLTHLYPVGNGDTITPVVSSGTPTAYFLPFLYVANGNAGAATTSATVEWAAWGTLA